MSSRQNHYSLVLSQLSYTLLSHSVVSLSSTIFTILIFFLCCLAQKASRDRRLLQRRHAQSFRVYATVIILTRRIYDSNADCCNRAHGWHGYC